MSDSDLSTSGIATHINFDAPATFRKWPSLNNQRRTDAGSPYLLVDDTLDQCIRQFLANHPGCGISTRFIRRLRHHLSARSYLQRTLPNLHISGIF